MRARAIRHVLLALLLAAAAARAGNEPDPAPSLDDLLEPCGPVWRLPDYVGGLRLLPDGSIVLTTWQDPEARSGPEPGKGRRWIRGEGPRREHGTSGVARLIDRRGFAWYQPASTKDQKFWVITNGSKTVRLATEGLSRSRPFEDSRGRVWVSAYGGVHCREGDHWRLLRMHDLDVPVERVYGDYGIAEHVDGAVLVWPRRIGVLRAPDEGGPWYRKEPAAPAHMVYFPGEGGGAPRTVFLGTDRVLYATPAPGGKWILRKRDGEPELWDPAHPSEKPRRAPFGPWSGLWFRDARPAPVVAAGGVYLVVSGLARSVDSEEEPNRASLLRMNRDGELHVVWENYPSGPSEAERSIYAVLDWPAFVRRLREAAGSEERSVASRLWVRLGPQARSLLERLPSDGVPTDSDRETLLRLLNCALQPELLAGSDDAEAGSVRDRAVVLNRRRLEEAFPVSLACVYGPTMVRDVDERRLIELDPSSVIWAGSHREIERRRRVTSLLVEGGRPRAIRLLPRIRGEDGFPRFLDRDRAGRVYYADGEPGDVFVVPAPDKPLVWTE